MKRDRSLLFVFIRVHSWFAFLGFVFLGLAAAAAEKPLYQNDFQTAKIGAPPEEMMILSGDFSVKEDGTNKFLELPGTPLDSFSLQFGPAETNAMTAGVTIRATGKGRRFPTFGVGVYGVAGYRLQVSPGKKALELYKDQSLLKSVAYNWKSDEWLVLRVRGQQAADGRWNVTGKVWQKGSAEPSAWLIRVEDAPEPSPSGRASIFASPFSGTPIDFDDLVVE